MPPRPDLSTPPWLNAPPRPDLSTPPRPDLSFIRFNLISHHRRHPTMSDSLISLSNQAAAPNKSWSLSSLTKFLPSLSGDLLCVGEFGDLLLLCVVFFYLWGWFVGVVLCWGLAWQPHPCTTVCRQPQPAATTSVEHISIHGKKLRSSLEETILRWILGKCWDRLSKRRFWDRLLKRRFYHFFFFLIFKQIKNALNFFKKNNNKKFNKIVSSKDDFQKYHIFWYNFESTLFGYIT